MKQAKIYKILLTAVAMLMFILASVAFIMPTKNTVYAEETASKPIYFDGSTASIDGTGLATIKANDQTFKFKNAMVADALEIKATVSNISKVVVTFNTDSYDVNASQITHKLVIELDQNNNKQFTFNEEVSANSISGNELNIKLKVDDKNVISASVNEGEFVSSAKSLYKVEKYAVCEITNLTFTFTLAPNQTEGTFKISSVNQDYNRTGYLQEFNFENGKVVEKALPRVCLGSAMYVKTKDGYKAIVYKFEEYSLELKAYSVLEPVSSTDLYLAKADEADDIVLPPVEKPKKVIFKTSDKIAVKCTGFEGAVDEITVTIKDRATLVESAPEYIDVSAGSEGEEILKNFNDALIRATKKKYTGSDKETYIKLGEAVKIPSMESLVTDDNTPYSKLSHTLYYSTPGTRRLSSTAGWEITTDLPGTYLFYVIFKDAQGESMDKEDIYKVDENDENKLLDTKYKSFIFHFEIQDDAEITVVAQQHTPGFINTKYTMSKFTFTGNYSEPVYELWYNKDSKATINKLQGADWVKIPVASEVKKTDVMPKGFTYAQVQSIGYEGELSFTPVKTGRYVIKCTVDSKTSINANPVSDYAYVEVTSAPTVVTPATDWLGDNLSSVIFLSIGTACLIGIVALLFIKPKAKGQTNSKKRK